MVSGISTAQQEPNSVNVYWVPENSQCIRKRYLVEYQLTNFDQCNGQADHTVVPAGSVTPTTIHLQGLQPYSTYTVHVRTVLNDSTIGPSSTGTFVTGQAGKISFHKLN